MRIAVFKTEPRERRVVESLAEDHGLAFVDGPLDASGASDHPDRQLVAAFIGSRLDRDALERRDELRHPATRTTGLDWCREHAIGVRNVPESGDDTVAETVLGLLLATSHRPWEEIGRPAIRAARDFGMELVAVDVKAGEDAAERLGVRHAPFETALEAVDAPTLHVPLDGGTRGMIDAGAVDRRRDGMVLGDTSRGGVEDVPARLDALGSGRIAAAALAVLPEEPAVTEEAQPPRSELRSQQDLETLLVEHLLLRPRKVGVTPHSAFETREAGRRRLDATLENIRGFRSGEPRNVVCDPTREPEPQECRP